MRPMNSCEQVEVELSALMDGELESEAIPRALEHLRECNACELYFQQLMKLDRASHLLRRDESKRETTTQRVGVRPLRGVLRNAWIAAAVLVAFLGGMMLPTSDLAADVPNRDEVLELSLGEDAGKMADARFVSLTVELLRADPRYHVAMYQVLQDVVAQSPTEISAPATTDFPR